MTVTSEDYAGAVHDDSNRDKPTVIGIYGVSGSGKSFLLNVLRQELNPAEFIFFEGSEVIASLAPGGLNAFCQLDAAQKLKWRTMAINFIKNKTLSSRKTAIVTGHWMFWSERINGPRAVYTSEDLDTFTHLIYLHIPVDVVLGRITNDRQKSRLLLSDDQLRHWQETEVSTIRDLCRQHAILFLSISDGNDLVSKVLAFVQHFSESATVEDNIARVRARVDDVLTHPGSEDLETILVLDGDKTLTAEDTGALSWKAIAQTPSCSDDDCPLRRLFSGPLGYSDIAFRQATLIYEEAINGDEFDKVCQIAAFEVTLHPEFVSLLKLAGEQKHMSALLVTCGIGNIWTKVLTRYGLSETVQVIGGSRISDALSSPQRLKLLLSLTSKTRRTSTSGPLATAR
ncbi:hypothetical protein ACHAPU_004819 [Fusarium lateritium]